MYAKRIILRNFKSFAKTTVELDRAFSSIVGPNGSGKCLRGDSRVLLSDGRLVSIRQLVDEALLRDSHMLDDGVVSLSDGRVRVLSLNPKSLKMEEKPVSAFVRRQSPDTLYEIATKSGRRVVATSYHPVLTVRDGDVVAVNADQLKAGTWVALPRALPLEGTPFSPFSTFLGRQLDVYVKDDGALVSRLRSLKGARGLTWKKLASDAGVSFVALRGLLDGQAILLDAAHGLARFAGYFDHEFSRFNRVKAKNQSIYSTIPLEMTPDLARFLGLVLSEGRLVRNEVFFSNNDSVLLDDFCGLSLRLFGVRPTVCRSGPNTFAVLPSRPVALLLEHVFGMACFGGSAQKTVPASILSSSRGVVAAFISGLFDGDGFVSDPCGKKAVLEYVSKSR
ncbi:MAG: hypothetical protein Q8P02_05370, partial [Candidatus Micrarchaeota archaeon]|nr:hypothetical protein [Candidatus Micrarchaeota archaeon]